MTTHIGLDLAWGEQRPTGIAVLDDAGTLVHLSSARTDDDPTDRIFFAASSKIRAIPTASVTAPPIRPCTFSPTISDIVAGDSFTLSCWASSAICRW